MQKQYNLLSDNPITRAELSYQRQQLPRRRRWRRWFDRLISIAVYGLIAILVANEIVILFLFASGNSGETFAHNLSERFSVLMLLPLLVALVMHFRRMFQTLGLSADSIVREYGSNNWDMLVLTGVDARKIVYGKWWATVRRMWRPYVMLGILRALLVVWYGAASSHSYFFYGAGGNLPLVLPTLLQLIAGGFAVFILTLANLLFTAACGMTAFNKRSGVAVARVIATRLAIIIGICIVGALIYRWWAFYAYYNYSGYNLVVPMIGLLSLVTLFDNGVTMGSQFATYRFDQISTMYGSEVDSLFAVFLPVLLAALVIYGLLTFLLLRFAQWQAVRQNALPPLPTARKNTAKMT